MQAPLLSADAEAREGRKLKADPALVGLPLLGKRYRLLRECGRGNFSRVFVALDTYAGGGNVDDGIRSSGSMGRDETKKKKKETRGLVAVKVMNEGCEELGVQEWHRVNNINRVASASGCCVPIMRMAGQSQSSLFPSHLLESSVIHDDDLTDSRLTCFRSSLRRQVSGFATASVLCTSSLETHLAVAWRLLGHEYCRSVSPSHP